MDTVEVKGDMAMERIVVGVDGGGTKTSLVAYRIEADGTLRAQTRAQGAGINYNTVGVQTAVSRLTEGISSLYLAPGTLCAVGIGDPSCDVDTVGEAGNAFREGLLRSLGVPILLKSDAYMTLYALTEGQCAGALTIAGTGAISLGEDRQGNLYVRGGWGQLTGDEGSGYYIGLAGWKAALRSADGIAPPTALLPAILKRYACTNPRDLIQVLYDPRNPVSPAELAPLVDACAQTGDTVSLSILQKAAGYLADYTAEVVRAADATAVGVYGSVLTRNSTVRHTFTRLLREQFPDIDIREPSLSPEEAAARMAMTYTERK